jgi:hypothetical protein
MRKRKGKRKEKRKEDAARFFSRPGSYDPTQPLYIDPVLGFATYLGGSGDDKAYGVATDLAGDTFVTGSTMSSDFPTTVGPSSLPLPNGFVSKFNATGALVYSTYLSGSTGQEAKAIAVDAAGQQEKEQEKGTRKDCHVGIGAANTDRASTGRWANGFLRSQGMP